MYVPEKINTYKDVDMYKNTNTLTSWYEWDVLYYKHNEFDVNMVATRFEIQNSLISCLPILTTDSLTNLSTLID